MMIVVECVDVLILVLMEDTHWVAQEDGTYKEGES